MRTAGVVLCGGRSSRMGHPKAWLPFGGEMMLQRMVRIVGEAARPIVVVAAEGQSLPDLPPGTSVVRDEREEGRGPMQGLAAGLAALVGVTDAAFVSSCDVPLLKPAVIKRLIELLGEAMVCVPQSEGRLQPLTAVYRVEALTAVQRCLANQQLRLLSLLEEVAVRIVDADEIRQVDPHLHSLWNLNTPADYEAALRVLECPR